VKINYSFNYSLELKECKIDYLIMTFRQLLVHIATDFIKITLEHFANEIMKQAKKPFSCEKCGNSMTFIWKTRNAKTMKLMTVFAELILPQMQVQCKKCEKKMFITRLLLGVDKYQKMSTITQKMLAFMGSLTTFRVSEKITGMYGVKLNRMTIWRCVQKVGKTISFDIDPSELPRGQADGTGIPIKGIKKRGQELKVFIQEKVGGGARIAGLAIGKYDSGWDKLFAPLRETIMSFDNFLLITDGDTSIFKGIKCVNVLLQRCLWHIPHQLKYCLWQDKVKRKTSDWLNILAKTFNIIAYPFLLEEEEIEAVLKAKNEELDKLVSLCDQKGYSHCASYLRNAKPDMFTALEKRLNGKASSLVERVMKTVNMRVNVGKWTPSGALNLTNIRLAHYYNDWTPGEPEIGDVKINRL
jgi:hypothetical protein